MRIAATVFLICSSINLGFTIGASTGHRSQSLDVTMTITKPGSTCNGETTHRIPVRDRNGILASGSTPAECLDFCIWKSGRRRERRRLHRILREREGAMVGATKNASLIAERGRDVFGLSEADLRAEIE